MAGRLECPACGAVLTPEPADTGRIVPCPGCGVSIQMPERRRERRTEDDPPRRNRAAPEGEGSGRALLWVWVLLGASAAGLAFGALLFLLIGRDTNTPAEPPGPVAELPLPKVPPSTAPTPPVAPPDTTPKKPLNPPAKLPKGPPVAPPVVPGAGDPVAAADIKGLRFYLPCDRIENGAVFELISGKFVGKGRDVELIDGPRGKAIRLTSGGAPGRPREGLNLSAHVEELAVAEGRPFTLALWARTDEWGNLGTQYIDAKFSAPGKFSHFSLYQYLKGVGVYLADGVPGKAVNVRDPKTAEVREVPHTKEWIHLAMSRDENGVVRWAVNGDVREIGPAVYTAEFRFTEIALGWRQGTSYSAEFDEFCLFDRALTAEEIKGLATRAK